MRSHARHSLLFALFGLVGCASDTALHSNNAENVEAACARLIMDYALYRDQGNGEALANLFTEDAVLLMNGETFTGHTALKARATNSSDSPFLTHLMSTVQIYPESVSRARGLSYVSVYLGSPGAAAAKRASLAAVGEYRDQFIKTNQGWKIARREYVSRITFQ
ncbi:MAG: nuclear transport factor 2 family protein [Pseudomonadales bacterium]